MAANHLNFVVCCVTKAGGGIQGLGVAVGTDDIFSHDFGTSELLAVSLIRVAPCAYRRRESHIRKKKRQKWWDLLRVVRVVEKLQRDSGAFFLWQNKSPYFARFVSDFIKRARIWSEDWRWSYKTWPHRSNLQRDFCFFFFFLPWG